MKQPNKYISTALVDADYIIWIAANGVKLKDKQGAFLRDEKGRFVYRDKTLDEALSTCDSYIKDILGVVKADSYILFLTASKNFRYEVDPSYKGNRVGKDKPLWFSEIRNHMKEKWDAIDVQGLEADDLVVLTRNNLENSFILGCDKDVLDCIPGKHFDARKGRAEFIETTEDFASNSFAISMLVGDTIDGIPNLKTGYGPKTAEKELSDTLYKLGIGTTELEAVSHIYQKHLGEYHGITRFAKQYKLLKILDSFEQIPEGVSYIIPEPSCFNCVETILSDELLRNALNDYYDQWGFGCSEPGQ